ncbi:MAG: TVP38/TMEM64 family protein [Polyangiaceae bacterium]
MDLRADDRRLKIAIVVAVIVLLLTAERVGILRQLKEPSELARSLVALGAWGYLAFIVAYALLQPFGIPGTVFVVAAALIWPWPIAFALSMTGTMAASVVGFSFARLVARDWIAKRIPERFKKYDDALAARAFLTVFTLRIIFWMPPLLHAFFGVSKVRFWTHFWGSFVGYLLPLFLMSYFGEKLFEMVRSAPPQAWIATASAIAVIGAAVFYWRRRNRISARAS